MISQVNIPCFISLHLDKIKISVSQLMEECSYVELETSSLIRILYKGCFLQKWVRFNFISSLVQNEIVCVCS